MRPGARLALILAAAALALALGAAMLGFPPQGWAWRPAGTADLHALAGVCIVEVP